MPTYRKKPVIVQAFKFTGELNQDVPEWFRNAELQNIATRFFSSDGVTEGACHIKTLEGEIIANIGDFIIKGVAGELYPCKPNIFEQTYEQVTQISQEKDMTDKNKCYTCGYEWETGKDGSHSCSDIFKRRINKATDIAARFGQTDGAHHKTWVIDQMVRTLTGDDYPAFVDYASEAIGEDGPFRDEWDCGIAP